MKLVYLVAIFLLLNSCDNGTEELRLENQRLKLKNDSLTTEIGRFKLIPYLEPLRFETTLNDTFYTKALLIQQNGLTIDSLDIKGMTQTETEEMIELVSTDNGTRINFNATKTGTFEVKLFARVPIWDNRIVPLKIPITVNEKKN